MRDAEIDEPRASGGVEQDVARLHVTVDHTALVGVEEGVGDLGSDPHHRLGQERPASREPCGQGFALDELEDDRRALGAHVDVVDRNDSGVAQRGHRACLRLEPSTGGGIGQQVRVEQLHRHGALQLRVEGAPDLGTPADRDLLLEPVAIEDERLVTHRNRSCSSGMMRDALPASDGAKAKPRTSTTGRRPTFPPARSAADAS